MKRLKFIITAFVLLLILAATGSSLHFYRAEEAGTGESISKPAEQTAEPAPPAENTEQPAPPAETAKPPVQPKEFTISLIGDITPDTVAHYKNTPAAYQKVVTEDNLGYVYEKTKQFFENDDFTIANMECVLSDSDLKAADKNFVFKAPASYAKILTEGKTEFVTIGNNHVLDYGQKGYDDTKAALDAVGVKYAGRDEYTLYTTESGLKIGVYADSFSSVDKIKKGIAALKEAGAEFIIAALHWGDEGSYKINDMQKKQGHAAIDAGADLVYGTHPHTLQPVEKYNGKYIFYSMGNWSFGGNTNPRDKDTVIAQLKLNRGEDGIVTVTGVKLIPCVSSGVENGNNYQPAPLEESDERYKRVLSKLDGTFSGANLEIGYSYGVGELG
ncbi:MAG: CapA family protein [Ruminococcaceae bacterium]|nr:CapA family protein [Oscillospiraceae bacterium]